MKITLFILFLALGLLACTAGDQPQPEVAGPATTENTPAAQPATTPPANTARRNVVFFGNSLTAAYNLSPEQGFPALIQRKIDSLGLPYTCVNAGLSGETTAGGLSRIDWVLQQPVDIFVLELGANDALRGLDLGQSKKNLQGIIDKVKAKYPAARLVIAGMMAPPNYGGMYTAQFRQMYVDLARANNAVLIPFLLEGVATMRELNLEDGIHPNIEGQKIVAETVWRVLQPVLNEAQSDLGAR